MLYAGAGSELTQYDVDMNGGALTRRASVRVQASIQEAWFHPSGRYLYVAWSNRSGGAGKAADGPHGIAAFKIDPVSGALTPHGSSATLRYRPVYITGNIAGTHLVVAYPEPSSVSVHALQPDGTIGQEVAPQGTLDVGVYAHQVRVSPTGKTVILVTRGNAPTADKREDPGALKIFRFRDGVLSNLASVAPGGGYHFQARHLDFHPTRPWLFLALEKQSKLDVFRELPNGALDAAPLFTNDTIAHPENARGGQAAGTVHVHPNGSVVYVSNRGCDTPADCDTVHGISDGENSIGVFSVDQKTGEPKLIQTAPTQGLSPRTFTIESSGRLMVVGNQLPLSSRGREGVTPNLAVFRIHPDGTLEFSHKYDVTTSDNKGLFWVGMVLLPDAR